MTGVKPDCGHEYAVKVLVTDSKGCTAVDSAMFQLDDTELPTAATSTHDSIINGCDATAVPAAKTTVADLETIFGAIDDNCTSDAGMTVTSSDAVSGKCPMTVTRTYTVSDSCGKSITLTHTFTVQDTAKPVFTHVPGDTTLYKNASCFADTTTSSIGMATATDNCTSKPIITYVDGNFSSDCPGSYRTATSAATVPVPTSSSVCGR